MDLDVLLKLSRDAYADARTVANLIGEYNAELIDRGFLEQPERQQALALRVLCRQLLDAADVARGELDSLAAAVESDIGNILALAGAALNQDYSQAQRQSAMVGALYSKIGKIASLRSRLASITLEITRKIR